MSSSILTKTAASATVSGQPLSPPQQPPPPPPQASAVITSTASTPDDDHGDATAADLISSEAPRIPGQPFSDIEELKSYLQDWAGDHGFAISCTSSRGGDYYTMRCKKSRGTSACPWTMVVRRFFFAIDQSPQGRLAWTTTNFEHNHPPMPRGTFAIHRRPTAEVREYIEKAGERGDKPRAIVAAVRKMDGCAEFDVDTVYYILAQWRRRSKVLGEGGRERSAEAGGENANGEVTGIDPVVAAAGPADAGKGSRSAPAGNGSAREPEQVPNGNPEQAPGPGDSAAPPTDARGRAKPFCNNCQSYVRHHGGVCREPQRKRKKAGHDGPYKDAGTQTEPIDILRDPQLALQIAAILRQASETVRRGRP